MKRWVRTILFMLGGATIMLLCLLWVSQFFTGSGNVIPVIWIEEVPNGETPQDQDAFAEWQDK